MVILQGGISLQVQEMTHTDTLEKLQSVSVSCYFPLHYTEQVGEHSNIIAQSTSLATAQSEGKQRDMFSAVIEDN